MTYKQIFKDAATMWVSSMAVCAVACTIGCLTISLSLNIVGDIVIGHSWKIKDK